MTALGSLIYWGHNIRVRYRRPSVVDRTSKSSLERSDGGVNAACMCIPGVLPRKIRVYEHGVIPRTLLEIRHALTCKQQCFAIVARDRSPSGWLIPVKVGATLEVPRQ